MMLWALSGFSTLTFELVWMREMTLWSGDTVTASTLVIAVFFLCAASGNLLAARLMRQRRSPMHCYAGFEMLAALVAIGSHLIVRQLWLHIDVMPEGWWLRAGVALLMAGPAAFCSGVAFPSLAESFVPGPGERVSSGAVFYALNLLGAALAVAAGGVMLPWWLGIQASFEIAAAIQFAGGVLAWFVARTAALRSDSPRRDICIDAARSSSASVALLGVSGALSLATQSMLLLWVKQVLEGSIYAATAALATFVSGLGLGALTAGALRRRRVSAGPMLRVFACAASLGLFVLPWLGNGLSTIDCVLGAHSPMGMLLQSLLHTGCILLPLTFAIGGIFPAAWELAGASSASEGEFLGKALALNKLGSAAGVMLGLFVFMPLLGLGGATHALAWGYAILAVLVVRPSWRIGGALLIAGLCLTLSMRRPPGVTGELRLIESYSGAYGPVSVVEDKHTDSRQILLNSRQRLSGTRNALASQQHQSWVPLLFCKEPKRVMTIGMAAGISAAAALDFPIERLDAVELVPEVVRAAHAHFGAWNAPLFDDPRARVICDDGRLVLAQSREQYDAIICDLFFPGEEGTAHLYSREFFELARSRLSERGVFCVWLPCYQHTAATADIVVRSFLGSFPYAIMVRSSLDPVQPVVGLIGSSQKLPVSAPHFAEQIHATKLDSRSPFLRSGTHAQMLLTGDLRAAEPGFDGAPITTDDRPVFAFLGPLAAPTKEVLIGVTFLNWAGRRFPYADFPSCEMDVTPPDDLLAAIRAANHYLAAAVAATALPGDHRPPEVRELQMRQALERARGISPSRSLDLEDLGH